MIDCNRVLQDLWDWLADPDAHPDNLPIREHLEHCAACASEAKGVGQLRAALGQLRESPAAGFEARLRERLRTLEDAPRELRPAAEARVVAVSFWRRPLALVATGAAAVLVLGLTAGRFGTEPGLPGAAEGVIATAEPVSSPAPVAAPIGVVSDRAWQPGDSLEHPASGDPRAADPLTPVSSATSP
jgi:hypothetical protein